MKFVALPVSEIIAIKVLGRGCKPAILGKSLKRRSGVVAFERRLVSFYMSSI